MTTTIVSIDAFLALAAAIINAAFALLIIVRTSRTTVYLTFFFICLATVTWNLGDFMAFITGRRPWFYFSLIGTGMIPALLYHFISALVVPPRPPRRLLKLVYVPCVLLALSSPLAMFDAATRTFVDSFAWNIFYFSLLIPVSLWSIGALHRTMRLDDEEKERLRYIFLAVIIGVLTGITDLVQIMEVRVPPLGHLGTVLSSSILAIGVFKHRSAYDILIQTQMRLNDLSEMAASLAHEIRNPLSSLKGAAALLRKGGAGIDPKAREYLELIAEETERLNMVLVNFQHFTKPMKIELEEVSINDVMRKISKLTEPEILDMKLILNLDDGLPVVMADPVSLKQVFLNLIKNAYEACGSKNELTIKTGYEPPWVKIIFSDNGPGIPAGSLSRIFEPFFTTKASGMGLGLAISKRIIDAHNGKMEVRNRLPKGVEFSILLPVRG